MNIIVGSLTAFLVGQIADAFIFRRIKFLTGEKRIWMRATLSTLVSQLIDSFIVTYIAFYIFRGVSFGQCTAWAITAYTYKFVIAILFTPVVYFIHWMAEKYLGRDLALQMKQSAMQGYWPYIPHSGGYIFYWSVFLIGLNLSNTIRYKLRDRVK